MNENSNKVKLFVRAVLVLCIILPVGFFLYNINHLLFHTVIQIFTTVITFSVLIVAVNTYGISKNNFFIILGIGFSSVGLLGIVHTIAYPGMGLIKSESLNISYQALIISMYFEAITILASYILLKRRSENFKPYITFFIVFATIIVILVIMFNGGVFPAIFDESNSITMFFNISEIIVLLCLILAAFLYYRIRKNIDYSLFLLIEHYIVIRIFSFILVYFANSSDSINAMVHVLKLLALYFIYKASIEIGLKTPYKHLYFELNEINIKLEKENTIRKNIEEAFLSNEEFHRLLIENSRDVIIVHSEGKVIFANEQAVDFFGVNRQEELLGKSIYYFVPEEEYDKICGKIKEVYDNKLKVASFETKLRKTNNEIADVEASGIYFVYNGKPSIAATIRELKYKTQVEKLTKDFNDSNLLLNESREYNKLITEFISNISHELRTPLNVILGAVQLMGITNKEDKYLDMMKQNCYRLLRLVNNLIDISKIDSGYLELNLKNYNIVNIIEEITLSVAGYIENKGVSLIFDTNTEEKIMACDFDKLERIMLNLLSNAIKFTKSGDSITVELFDLDDQVSIHVKDTGIGIPQDKANIIFERFAQVDKSFTRNHEGSGIGLALVKSLIEMHGGSISLKSDFGVGSEFIITIPVTTVNEEKESNKIATFENNVERINIEFSDIYTR